ncbi:hypothetical protein ACVIHD_005717 [Bradyrhizobium embrapense]
MSAPFGKRPSATPEPSTYFEMSQHRDLGTGECTPVVGTAPVYGADLPGPAWSRDAASLPRERPLGECVDALPDLEACHWEPDAVGPKGGDNGEA